MSGPACQRNPLRLAQVTAAQDRLNTYRSTVAKFLQDCDEIEIGSLIHDRYVALTGRRVGPKEQASWDHSLSEMARVLRRSQIDESVGVGIELFAPQATSRVDFSLSGFSEPSQKRVILIELKHWGSAEVTDKDAIVRTVLGGGKQDVPHPSYQAWSYANLFEGFNEAVASGDIQVVPCAFLHNYEANQPAITDTRYDVYLQKAPVFLKGWGLLNHIHNLMIFIDF